MAITPSALARVYPLTGASATRFNISNKAITTNLATITTSAVHGITQVGTIVTIQGVDSTFDGTWVIHSIPTTSTFTFVSTTATVASAAVSPVGVAIFNAGVVNGFTISNKVVQNYIATLTTSSAHGLAVNDVVAVTIGDTIYDGMQIQVIAVPSTTTFSYIVTTQTSATTAVTQGAYGKFPAIYTVPASATAIVTSIIVTNLGTLSASFSIFLDGFAIASQQQVASNASAYFDLKQVLTTSKTVIATSSSSRVNIQLSGTVVA